MKPHFILKGAVKVGSILLALTALLITAACSNDMERVKFFDRHSLPSQSLTNATILRSESGLVQMRLEAAKIDKYDVPQPKTLYPNGVKITFFNEEKDSTATLMARYAVSWDQSDVMMARDSVVIIDYQTGDTIYLQDIVWNSQQKRIYSNNPLRAKNGERVTFGDSFHSDDAFQNLQIVNQRGTVVMEDE